MQPEPETTLTGSNGSHRTWAEHAAENGKDQGAHNHPRLVITCYIKSVPLRSGCPTQLQKYSHCVEVWAQKGKSWLLKSHHQIKIPIRPELWFRLDDVTDNSAPPTTGLGMFLRNDPNKYITG